MAVYRDGIERAAFPVALGFAPQGHKREQGDGRTPEGEYIISGRNPRSRFHLSLRVSYPGPDDALQAREHGVDPGGDIMVHGTPSGRDGDWTQGCIAVSDAHVQWLWQRVAIGTRIVIAP